MGCCAVGSQGTLAPGGAGPSLIRKGGGASWASDLPGSAGSANHNTFETPNPPAPSSAVHLTPYHLSAVP
jgi:hypothetical protein